MMKNLLLGIAIGFGLLFVLFTLMAGPTTRVAPPGVSYPYSHFIADIDDDKVQEVTFQGPKIYGRFKTGYDFQTLAPHSQVLPALTGRLLAKKVTIAVRPVEDDQSTVIPLIANLICQALFFGALWLFMARPMSAARCLRQGRAPRCRRAARSKLNVQLVFLSLVLESEARIDRLFPSELRRWGS